MLILVRNKGLKLDQDTTQHMWSYWYEMRASNATIARALAVGALALRVREGHRRLPPPGVPAVRSDAKDDLGSG